VIDDYAYKIFLMLSSFQAVLYLARKTLLRKRNVMHCIFLTHYSLWMTESHDYLDYNFSLFNY